MTTIHRDHEVLYAEVELSIHKSLNYVFSRGHFVPVLSPLYKFYIIMVGGGCGGGGGGGGVVGGGGGGGGGGERERGRLVTMNALYLWRYFPDEKYGPIIFRMRNTAP